MALPSVFVLTLLAAFTKGVQCLRDETTGPKEDFAKDMTAAFNAGGRTLALRGNSHVKLLNWKGGPAVYKALRFYRGEANPEKVKLFRAEAEMATKASNAGIGCEVYYWSDFYAQDAMPMIVMKPMGMGVGDAIKAGADPDLLIAQLTSLFDRLKEEKVFWEDVTSPNNIMTETTDVSAIGEAGWYFIDFGTSVSTAEAYNEKAESFATKPHLYDELIANFWTFLSLWVNKGLDANVDFNKTKPGIDPQTMSMTNQTEPRFFKELSGQERQNLVKFKNALRTAGKWPEWL